MLDSDEEDEPDDSRERKEIEHELFKDDDEGVCLLSQPYCLCISHLF